MEPKTKSVDLLSDKDFVYKNCTILRELRHAIKDYSLRPAQDFVNVNSLMEQILSGMKKEDYVKTLLSFNIEPLFKYLQAHQHEYDTKLIFDEFTEKSYNDKEATTLLIPYLDSIVFPFLFSADDSLRHSAIGLILTLHNPCSRYTKSDIVKASKVL